MESFFSRYKNALLLMLLVLAQVVLLAMQVRRTAPNMQDGHNIRLWRYWVASLVTPPEKLAHGIGLRVRGVWSHYIYLRHLKEQNEGLQDENTRLRLEQASLAEDAREGQRLREMLDFRAEYIDTTVPAQVIGTSGTDQAHVIYIDKGSKDGIRPQMPVITPDGVVGKVKNVFPGTSQVLLISDQTSGAGVMLQTTRIRGVLKGNVLGQPQMINISPDERIQPGEIVLTSGGDQVYPRGLPVGVVEEVVPDPDTSYVNVIVKPNANLQKLEEVMVITRVSDKMPFGQEKDMMQSEVDAYAEKERAADILSEKLPSLKEAELPEETPAGDSSAAATEGGAADPARPMRPPQPLHPDRYSPGSAPEASSLTPGQGGGVKYAAAGESDGAAKSAKGSAGSRTAGGTATASGETTNQGVAIPKSRFPVKAVPATPSTGTGTASSGSVAAAAASPATGAAMSGSPGANVVPKALPRTAGSGFALPLQAADSNAARRAAAVANGTGNGGVNVSPNGTTAGKTAATAGTVASPTAPRTPRAVGAATGTSSGTAPAPGSSTGGIANPRRPTIPSDNGGILTPAGMGSPIVVPRPKPATPAANPTAKPGGNQRSPAPRSPTARPPSVQQQPAPKPQAPPPGGF
jgi:rod shape-determining protein MreC